jgi:hypothetical protein
LRIGADPEVVRADAAGSFIAVIADDAAFEEDAGKAQRRQARRLVAFRRGARVLDDLAFLQKRLQIVTLDDV